MTGTTHLPKRFEWLQASAAVLFWPMFLGFTASISKHDITRFYVQFVKGWSSTASLKGFVAFLLTTAALAVALRYGARFGRSEPYRLYLVAGVGLLLIPQGERIATFDPRAFLWSFVMTYLLIDRTRAFIQLLKSKPSKELVSKLDEPLGLPWTLSLTGVRILLTMLFWDAVMVAGWLLLSPGFDENYGGKYILSLQWFGDFRYGLMLQSGWAVVAQIGIAFVFFELLRRHFGKPSWFALVVMLLAIGLLNPTLQDAQNGMGIAPPAAVYAFGGTFVLFYILGGALKPLIAQLVLRYSRRAQNG